MYSALAFAVVVAIVALVLLVRRQFPGLRAPNLPPGRIHPSIPYSVQADFMEGLHVFLSLEISTSYPKPAPISSNYTVADIHIPELANSVQFHRMGRSIWPGILTQDGVPNCHRPELSVHDKAAH